MLFNPDTNKQAIEVYVTNKEAVGNIPQLTFNGITVKSVNCHRHLGLRNLTLKIAEMTKLLKLKK